MCWRPCRSNSSRNSPASFTSLRTPPRLLRAFRSDLSVSVPELGSLLEHTSVVGEAEREAALNFGADRTYFVTNGTSTSNNMVWHGCVSRGDVVIVDRNCHRSILHSLIMTGAVPVYFRPTRNPYGIIGLIPAAEFTMEAVQKKIDESPLIADKKSKPRLAVVTNSTHDGLCSHRRRASSKPNFAEPAI
ncbi:hypothetical protein CUJ87_24615 [Paraburkholderia caledonica]|nr:hypothetical protein CUJ87_24615 [Paraburkholderia caledonica]